MEERFLPQLSILDSTVLPSETKYFIFPELTMAFSYLILQSCLSCPPLLPNARNSSQIKMDLKWGLFDKHSARLTSRSLLQSGDLFRIWVLRPSHDHSTYNRQVKSKCIPALTWPRLWRLKSRPHVNSVWCSTVSSKGLGLEKSQNL